MINKSALHRARGQIADRFLNQCAHGPQNAGFPEEVRACGQYLNTRSPQRGVHGTAAAVRVLGGRDEGRPLVGRLVSYLAKRIDVERRARTKEEFVRVEKGFALDEKNVIKLSEQLYALHFVPPNQAHTEKFREEIARRLIGACWNESGWTYFTDEQAGGFEPLPTAFAIRALALGGYPVRKPAMRLWQAIRKPKSQSGSEGRSDATVRIFGAFVLAFASGLGDGVAAADLRRTCRELWKAHERLLSEDIEQNIEYFHGEDHLYVRVPWQIYLLALAIKIAPFRMFASIAAQRRLGAIVQALDSDAGFIYPHSGSTTSSRTNAVLYDALCLIEDELAKQSISLLPAFWWDRFRSALGSIYVRAGVAVGAAVLAIFALIRWSAHGSLGEIAPELIAAALVFLMTFGKSHA